MGALTAAGVLAASLWMVAPGAASPAAAADDPPCTHTWTGASADGLWTTDGNWQFDEAPGSGAIVCIGASVVTIPSGTSAQVESVRASSAQLSIPSGARLDVAESSILGEVDLDGGAVGGAGDVTFAQQLSWASGSIDGAGVATTAIGASLTTTASKQLGRTLVNLGEVSQSGPLDVADEAGVVNAPGATWMLRTFWPIRNLASTPGAEPLFHNEGLLTVRTNVQARIDGVRVDNDGTIRPESGATLQLNEGAHTSSGTIDLSVGMWLQVLDDITLEPGSELDVGSTASPGLLLVDGQLVLGGRFRAADPPPSPEAPPKTIVLTEQPFTGAFAEVAVDGWDVVYEETTVLLRPSSGDPDPVPPTIVVPPQSLLESAGSTTLTVQGVGGNVPATVPVAPGPGTAHTPADYVLLATTVVVPPGGSAVVPISIVDDALDEDDELFSLLVGGSSGTITILDDDPEPFVRVADAQVVEGDDGTRDLVFTLRLTDGAGTAVASGRTVTVGASTTPGTAADGVDYEGAAILAIFPAGQMTATFTVRVIGDTIEEGDETFVVDLASPTNAQLDPTDRSATGTIVDDDGPPPPAGEVAAELNAGRQVVADVVPEWGEAFDLDGFDLPALGLDPFELPVVTDDLASAFGTQAALGPASTPFAEQDGDLADVVADLRAAGITIDWAAGGVGGTPSPPSSDDLLQARTTTTLADLARVAGFAGDDLNDDAELLTGLAEALDLDADLGLAADLTLTLVFGVDVDGFYLSAESGLRLDVVADGTIAGTAAAGGAAGVDVAGRGDAELAAGLDATGGAARLRLDDLDADPFTLLRPSVEGTASADLDLAVAPLALTWSSEVVVATDEDGDVRTPTTAHLVGAVELPGFGLGTSPEATPARIAVEGRLVGGEWELEGEADVEADLRVDGFAVHALEGAGTVGPDAVAVSARLVLALGSGPTLVEATLAVGPTSWAGSATVTADALSVGPVHVDEPSLTVSALHDGTATTVSVSVTAAGGRVDRPGGGSGGGGEPLVRLTGLGGSIDGTGRVCVEAASVQGTIGDALTFDAEEVLVCSPGPDGVILRIGSVIAVVPELGELSVAITDLVLDAEGRFGAASVAVEQPDGIAQRVGLAGIVPVDLTGLVLTFPDQDAEGRITDLAHFVVALEGTVDPSGFTGLPFDPVIQIGGDVITPDSPPGDRRIAFSAEVDGVDPLVVRPLDLGPLTLGFTGLEVGDYALAGQVVADGYVGGVLQPRVCLEVSVTGGFDALDLGAALEACGSITETPTGPRIALEATATASLAVRDGVEIVDLALTALLTAEVVDGDVELGAALEGASVGRITIPFGDVATVQVTDASLDLTPDAGQPALAIGGSLGEPGSGAALVFGAGAGVFAGWGGRIGGIGLSGDLRPLALSGFFADVTVPGGERFGLPDFLPFQVRRIGLSLPGFPTGEVPEGVDLTPTLLAGLRLRVSGALVGTPAFPISASVDGLEVDLGRLLAFDPLAPIDLATFPITNLDGVGFAIAPSLDLGGLAVGGELTFGAVEANGSRVLYGRIRGDVSSPAFQAGADVVVSQYGPVLLRVTAPVGVPLGPTGFVLRSVTGAATFGPGGTVTPPRVGHPEDLLGELFDLPTDVAMTPAAIQAAVAPAVASGTLTWDHGFAVALQGDLTHVAAAGMLSGDVTLAASFGAPEPGQPERVQLVGRGEISAFGIPLAEGVDVGGTLAEAGILLDFADPLAPSVDLAFQSPVPGSPLAVVFPAQALVAAQLRTDGVITGIGAGLSAFVDGAVGGGLEVGGGLFADAFDRLAADLQANRHAALATLVLPTDDPREIDAALLRTRLVALLSSPETAALTAGPLLQAVGSSVAESVADGSFGLSVAQAADALYDVVAGAAADALRAAGAEFDPSFTFRGTLQPLLLGIPFGSPTTEVEVALDRRSLRFELTASMIESLKIAARQVPAVGPLAEQLLTLSTLGGRDLLTFGVQVPVPDLVDVLLLGGELDELDPADPGQGWSITVGGAYQLHGLEAQVTGFMTAPDNAVFVDTKVEKRWLSDGTTPPDPDRIQITRPQDYDNLIRYGGIVLDGRLEVPRLLTDPVDVLSELPPFPDDVVGIGQWFADGAAVVGQTETPLRMTAFAPGIGELLADPTEAAVEAWADAFVVTGVFEGTRQTPTSSPVARLLSLPIGEGRLLATSAGLEVTANVPLLGIDGTFVLRVDERDGTSVPAGGLELTMSAAAAREALEDLGFPGVFELDATASVRAYTPGFDPGSDDTLRRRGGLAVGATLDAPGFVDDAAFEIVVDPVGTGAGPDLTATASVDRIGPFAGTEIRDVTLTVAKVGAAVTIRVRGSATFGGTEVAVDGHLAPDLTGQLVFTASGAGAPTLGGLRFVEGGFALTLGRDGSDLVGEIGVAGTVELPAFLAGRSGSATATAAGCLGTDGDVEIRLGLEGLALGPSASLAGTGAPLSLDPEAPCTLPPGALDLPASAARIVVRTVDGTSRIVVDGAVRIDGSGLPLLAVTGDLSTSGEGSLAVSFGSGLSLSGFQVRGGASLTFTPTSFAIAVDGRVSVPNLVTDARVSGAITDAGIQSLTVAVTGLSLPPLQVASATLTLTRTAPSTYVLDTGLTVTVPGLRRTGATAATVTATGRIASNGDFDVDVDGTGFTLNGTGLTAASVDLARTGTTLRIEVTASFGLWGSTLAVTGQATVGPNGLSGNVDLRTPGGPISLGGWTVGGDLEIAFAASGATFSARVSLANGTVTVPGIGTLVANADMATDGSGSIVVTTPSGIRLGGGSSPFLGLGSFSLRQVGGVVTFGASDVGVAFHPVGGTEAFRVDAPSFSISSNGAFSVSTRGTTIGSASGLRVVIPSASLSAGAGGANVSLVVGAGSLTVPGLLDGIGGRPAALATPSFAIGTGAFRYVLFDARTIDLGLMRLNGRLVFERTSAGVFRLGIEANAFGPAHLDLGQMGRVDLGSFFVASDGSFSVTASTRRIGLTNPVFEIRDATFTFRQSGGVLDLAVTGGTLNIPSLSQPIALPALSIRVGGTFTRSFSLPSLSLGPFFRSSSATFTLTLGRTGSSFALDEPAGGGNDPSVTAFAGSTSLTLETFSVTSGGSFTGSVTGRLALFGDRISQTTFDVRLANGVLEMSLPSSRAATLDLGFVDFRVSGTARSDGTFSFTGSSSTSGNVVGVVSWNGSVSVTVANTGVSGTYVGSVSFGGLSGSTTGSMSSTGRVTGNLAVDLNLDGRTTGFTVCGPLGCTTIRESVAYAFDLAKNPPAPDTTAPVMAQPSNLTISTSQSSGSIPVSYTQPTATDARDGTLNARCTPGSGASFTIGATTTVTCTARDSAGNTTTRTFTIRVSFSAASVVLANGVVSANLGGFAATSVSKAVLRSEPVELADATADGGGRVHYEITMPTGLEPGDHHLVVVGTDPVDAERQWIVPVTVGEDGTVESIRVDAAPPALPPIDDTPPADHVPPRGSSPAPSVAAPSGSPGTSGPSGTSGPLARTGADLATPIRAALVLLVLGLALVAGSRARGRFASRGEAPAIDR